MRQGFLRSHDFYSLNLDNPLTNLGSTDEYKISWVEHAKDFGGMSRRTDWHNDSVCIWQRVDCSLGSRAKQRKLRSAQSRRHSVANRKIILGHRLEVTDSRRTETKR